MCAILYRDKGRRGGVSRFDYREGGSEEWPATTRLTLYRLDGAGVTRANVNLSTHKEL